MQEMWSCVDCGHRNPPAGLLCELCGVSRRYQLDPPLDVPRPPRASELPSFYLGMLWLLLTLAGTFLALEDDARNLLGLSHAFVVMELAAAAAAATVTLTSLHWQLRFHRMALEVPPRVESGEPFTVAVELVPYRDVDGLHVTVELFDRFYERSGGKAAQTRSRRLERHVLLGGGSLQSRRLQRLEAVLVAPFPSTPHSDVTAELAASLLGVLGWLVPPLGQAAHNLREHGGYYVRLTLRWGFLRHTVERRVFAYFVGRELYVG